MRRLRILLGLVLLGSLLAACSAAGEDTASDRATDGGDEATSGATVAAGGAGTGSAGSSTSDDDAPAAGQLTATRDVDLQAVPVPTADRKIIYTGTTNADVEDIGAAVREARDAATVEGGYVFAQDLGPTDGRVVLKVPVDRFDAVFDAIVGIGEIADQQIEAEDVTERFVDLESRQATLATSIDRIRGFLAQTTNVDEISRLESELTRREAEHDVIAGQLRVLRDRTSYGTITAHFRLADEAEALTLEEEESGPPGFGEGLSAGWDAVTTAGAAAATALGFALPFTPALLAGAAVVWWLRRRVTPAA